MRYKTFQTKFNFYFNILKGVWVICDSQVLHKTKININVQEFVKISFTKIFKHILLKVPGERYVYGYNADQGDKILFKTGDRHRIPLPMTERK